MDNYLDLLENKELFCISNAYPPLTIESINNNISIYVKILTVELFMLKTSLSQEPFMPDTRLSASFKSGFESKKTIGQPIT